MVIPPHYRGGGLGDSHPRGEENRADSIDVAHFEAQLEQVLAEYTSSVSAAVAEFEAVLKEQMKEVEKLTGGGEKQTPVASGDTGPPASSRVAANRRGVRLFD